MDFYTKKIFIFALLICSAVYAATFSCGNLDTTACKNKFSKEFEAEFKELHSLAIQRLFTKYVAIARNIRDAFPNGHKYNVLYEEASSKVLRIAEKLAVDMSDIHKIALLFREGMQSLELDPKIIESGKVDKLIEKYDFKKTLASFYPKLAIDTGKLYEEFYSGLRPEDLKVYPQYTAINELMKKLREPDDSPDSPQKPRYYENAAKILYNDFNIQYFRVFNKLG